MRQPSITKICLKITYPKFHSNFPGANELSWFKFLYLYFLINLSNFASLMFFHFQSRRPWNRHEGDHSLQQRLQEAFPSREGLPGRRCSMKSQRMHSTHLPLDKMAAILADNIFKCIFLNETFCNLIKISLKFVPRGPIDNNPALVQIMAWRRTGDKPLSEPMLTQFTDAYMRH